MKMYYFLRQNIFKPFNIIEFTTPASEDTISLWIEGKELQAPRSPLLCMLNSKPNAQFGDYFDTTIPIMSHRLIAHLENLGVCNFDQFPVVFKSPITGEEFNTHSAVYFKGIYDAIDLTQSTYKLRFGKPYFSGQIILDPAKVGELAAFRLATGPGFLVVIDSIAKALEATKYKATLLQPTHDYEGM